MSLRRQQDRFDGTSLLYIVLLYPVMWMLGIAYFVWPLLTLPLLVSLLVRRKGRVPRGFSLWLFFLAWTILGVFALDTGLRYALFAWRLSVYLSATILFLYAFNLPKRPDVDRRLVFVLTVFWAEVIVGGLAGVFFPKFSIHSPAESVLPHRILSDPTGYAYIHPALTDLKSRALGHTVGRPKTLFGYTNQWGAAVGILTPFAIVYVSFLRRRLWRWTLIGLLVISAVPIVVSLDRGLWIALVVAGAYTFARSVSAHRLRTLIVAGVGTAAVAAVIITTPLGSIVSGRLQSKTNSNETRASLYREAVTQVRASPLIGYGSPRPSVKGNAYQNAHTGTQGQFFLVLFSNGIPGLLFYMSWFFLILFRASARERAASFSAHVSILISLVESAVYDLMPTAFCIVTIAAAVAVRARVAHERLPMVRSARTFPASVGA
jgi:polysaccharide biosynthesis protein PslJ